MASEFTSMFSPTNSEMGQHKPCSSKAFEFWPKSYRCGKSKLAIQATSVLLRERKKLEKILSQTAPTLLSKLTPIEQDYRTIGSVFAKAGKAESEEILSESTQGDAREHRCPRCSVSNRRNEDQTLQDTRNCGAIRRPCYLGKRSVPSETRTCTGSQIDRCWPFLKHVHTDIRVCRTSPTNPQRMR